MTYDVDGLADSLKHAYSRFAAWELDDEDWRQIVRMVLKDKLTDSIDAQVELPAWVEELTSAWIAEAGRRSRLSEEAHARGEDLHAAYCAGMSAGYARCAEELRQKVKGTSGPDRAAISA